MNTNDKELMILLASIVSMAIVIVLYAISTNLLLVAVAGVALSVAIMMFEFNS